MEAGRQNVRQHGQVHDLGQGLVLVRKLEQVEIGVGDHDVAGLPADPAAHVPDEVSASTEHLSARTSSKRLTSDPDVRRQDLQRPLHVDSGRIRASRLRTQRSCLDGLASGSNRPFAVIRRHHADRRLRAGTGNSVQRYRRPFPLSTHAFELRPPTEMTNRTGAWMVKALSFSTIQSSKPSFRRARRGACPFRQHR